MACKVTVELLDPTTGSVVESKSADGVLTNALKYLSNCGYPATEPSPQQMKFFTNPDWVAGGLVCFEDAVLDDSKDNIILPLAKKTAFGSYYTASPSGYSPRCGAYVESAAKQDAEHFTKVWEFNESSGNGKISSIALTHRAGALAYDPEYTGNEWTGNLSINSDYVACAKVLNGDTRLWGYDSSTLIVSFKPRFSEYCGRSYLENTFYETEDKFVFLGFKYNIEQTSEGYRTEIVYKVVDKKWLYKFPFSILLNDNTNPLSTKRSSNPIDLYGPTDEVIDGTFSIITPSSINNGMLGRQCSDGNSMIVISSNVGNVAEGKCEYNPDGIDVRGRDINSIRVKSFVISGAPPKVEEYDSVYASPMWQFSQGNTNESILSDRLFLKDRSYIYYCYNNQGCYIARRSLASDALIWHVPLDFTGSDFSTVNNVMIIEPYFARGCFGFPVKQNGSSSSTRRILQLRSIEEPWVVKGYMSYVYKEWNARNIDYYADSPVCLNHYEGDANQVMIKTGYAYTKATLAAPIIKTSAHKMRITVDVTLD